MLKATWLAVDALTVPELIGVDAGRFRSVPTHGVVAALSYLDAVWNRQTGKKVRTGKTAAIVEYCNATQMRTPRDEASRWGEER
ncbi:MAG: hypothetical protein ABSA48_06980 [Terracidiphilus sp.]|jgi:hypothetical protein